MQEIWKEVSGFEGYYQVSNFGNVRRVSNVKCKSGILKPQANRKGYLTVFLYKDCKWHKKFVHRLVASAFIPNHEELPFVGHKDNDRKNNAASNLKWCTKAEIAERSGISRRKKQKEEIV